MSEDAAKPFTDAEIRKFMKACVDLPSYKNGCIGAEDLYQVSQLIEAGFDEMQMKAFGDYVHKYMNGKLSFTHLEEWIRSTHQPGLLADYFAKLSDRDHTGKISKEEFLHIYEFMSIVFPSAAGHSFQHLLKGADTDRSGDVSVDEFAKWFDKISKK